MDYVTTTDEPTAMEQSAVDAVLGPEEHEASADHTATGGYHAAAARRHLLLPALESVQSAVGWVSHGALNYLSQRLPVSPAEAYGVATFYDLIATEERPPRVAFVCDDIGCKARGVDSILSDLTERFGESGVDADGAMWQPSPCLGQCDKGSAAFVQVAGSNDVILAPAPAEQIINILRSPKPLSSVAITAVAGSRLLATAPGHDALTQALAIGPEAIVNEIKRSGLRGRGGAAFPAGVKWEAVANSRGQKYVVCNADESEPGTFKDRVLMEADPSGLIDALTIAGFAVGASKGYIYIRGEYPIARGALRRAIAQAKSEFRLGDNVAESGWSFEIELRSGAGAYICGEETALFNSIEGFRGEPRQKPPFPTEAGLFGQPTLVNNVESLMNVSTIVLNGGEAFASTGTPASTGTKLFCVSGNVRNPGLYEEPFGATANDLIRLAGGVDGDLAAVLTGGAAGTFIAGDQLDIPLTFEDARDAGISLGSGVVLVFNTDVDMASIVTRIAEFFEDESCGLCIPCRVGTARQHETLLRITSKPPNDHGNGLVLLSQLDNVLRDASICGLGQAASSAVQSAVALGLVGMPQ